MFSNRNPSTNWKASLGATALLAVVSFAAYPANGFAQDATEVAIKILERLDTNKDGNLDPDEIPDGSRAAVERIASQIGVSADSSISINKLRKQLEKEQKKANAEAKNEESDSDSAADRNERGNRDRRNAERSDRDERGSTSGFSSTSASPSTSNSSSSKSGFGAESGSAKDPKMIAYVESLFKTSDKNRNGYIDGKEIETIRTRDNPKDWDSNKDGKLSKSEVTDNLTNRGSSRSTSASSESNSSSDSNRRSGRSGMARTGSRSSSTNSSTSSQYQDRYKRYADSLLKRYDENKDGFLKKDEWGRVRNAEEADKNKDGVLTVDELAEQLKGLSSPSTRSTSTSSESSRTSSRRDERSSSSRDDRSDRSSRSRSTERSRDRGGDRESRADQERRSYRALTAHERLPSGLPSWFTDKDKNVNGQIEMAEYTSSWSDAKVKEFAEYDLNDDGVITAVECLKSDN
jgi:Ca2+-binding EF-hand superfamily protein